MFDAAADWGKNPDRDSVVRLAIQCTNFRDKKTMLLTSNFGLKTEPGQIATVFEFFGSVRNYAVHPSAEFTRCSEAATALDEANHERIPEEGNMPYLPSDAIGKSLSVKSLRDLARNVHECWELIADIECALRLS